MAIWEWALGAYARPDVSDACLALQDDHGQNVSFPGAGSVAGFAVSSVTIILLVVAVQVFRARGNVASFFRVEWADGPWSGVERRRVRR